MIPRSLVPEPSTYSQTRTPANHSTQDQAGSTDADQAPQGEGSVAKAGSGAPGAGTVRVWLSCL